MQISFPKIKLYKSFNNFIVRDYNGVFMKKMRRYRDLYLDDTLSTIENHPLHFFYVSNIHDEIESQFI